MQKTTICPRIVVLATCLVAVPTSAALRVEAGATSYDASGFVRIAGTIHNDGGQPVCSPEVAVELQTATGGQIAVRSIITITKEELGQPVVDSVLAERTWLPAGESAVFTYLRDRSKLGGEVPARHMLRPYARPCEAPLPRIAVERFSFHTDEVGSHRITGTLRNVGSVGCRSPRVVLGLYAADGQLIGATSVMPDETFQKILTPRKTVDFLYPALQDPETGRVSRIVPWGDCGTPE